MSGWYATSFYIFAGYYYCVCLTSVKWCTCCPCPLISLLGGFHPSEPEAGRVSLSTHNLNLPFILHLKRGEGGNIETKSRKGPNRLASSVQNKEEGDWNNGMDINWVWWLCNHSLHQNGLLIQSMGDKKLSKINCKIGRTRTDAKSVNWKFQFVTYFLWVQKMYVLINFLK